MATGDGVVECPDYLPKNDSARETGLERRLGAALASAALPGLGQLILGAKRRAFIYFISLLFLALLYWPLRLPKTYGGFLFSAWLSFPVFLISACNALRAKHYRLPPASRWWMALFIPLAMFFSVLYVNGLFRASGFRNYSVPSSSMESTIGKGNLFVADMFAYRRSRPSPYEVIVFLRGKTHFVKRVIAGPGSTIEGKAGEIFVDGKVLSEPYVRHTAPAPSELDDFGPTLIPPGKLFVMGDNRDLSYDSRVQEFGLVDTRDILGKPLYVYRSSEGWRGRDIH
jgi:signal peptidase I